MLSGLVAIIIYIVIVALVVGFVLWLIQQIPIPAPFGQIVRVGTICVGVLVIIILLLRLLGGLDIPASLSP